MEEDRLSWVHDIHASLVRPNDDKLREWPPSNGRGCEGLACPAATPVPRPGAAPYSSSYCLSNTPTLFIA